jgi:hypothetical protein
MKKIETLIRRLFFGVAFVIAAVAVIEKLANLFKYTLLKGAFVPSRLLEYAAVALLFAMAMQLHQIRLLLSGRSSESTK